MNEIELMAIGAQHIHWNPDYNGGFHEYYLSIEDEGMGPYASRLGVRLGEHPDMKVKVYLIVPRSAILMLGVQTVADLLQLYRLVTGRGWNGREEK